MIIKSLIEEIIEGYREDKDVLLKRKGIELYGSILFKMFYKESLLELDNRGEGAEFFEVDILEEEFDKISILDWNETLHELHVALGSDTKSEGLSWCFSLKEFSPNKEDNNKRMKEIHFPELDVSRGEFPEDLRIDIEEALKPISEDLIVDFTTSSNWIHADMMEDEFEEFESDLYGAGYTEIPIVIIKAIEYESVEYAFELLEKILNRNLIEIY